MAERSGALLEVGVGIASRTGQRRRNEDFAGVCLGTAAERATRGIVAAIADGMGGAKGGREAAEVTVRGFLEGYHQGRETAGVQRTASHLLQSLNSWVCALGRADPQLAEMGCTFTALILRGRTAHAIHIGDTRLYRLSGDRLHRLTVDHALSQPGLTHILYRAIGIEEVARFDYATVPIALHDRFLLCSDGVHGALPDSRIAELLGRRSGPDETAEELVAAALEAGGEDNATALILDVVDLPPADQACLGEAIDPLPILPMPQPGDCIDGFRLQAMLSDGRYSRLFTAVDQNDGRQVVVKFPHPRVSTESACKAAFLREAWVAARVQSPWVGSVIPLPPGRQTRLYTVMPFYRGETLEERLSRKPRLTADEGCRIAVQLGKAVYAVHRVGVIHRDIKPDNVIIDRGGEVKLLDLGAVRVPGLEDAPPADIPGTPSYMAPELFDGEAGSEASDLFALGATLFRAFTGTYPYGEIEPFSHPRFTRPASLGRRRPDLPAWLDASIRRAISVDPAERHADVMEFVCELESGPRGSPVAARRRLPVYQRNPLLFWQMVAAALAVALVVVLIRR